jgi:hypothetical protein
MGQEEIRLCTQEQLDAMCRGADSLLDEAIDSGDAESGAETLVKVQMTRGAMLAMFEQWRATTLWFLADRFDRSEMAAALNPEEWLQIAFEGGLDPQLLIRGRAAIDSPEADAARLSDLIRAGDPAAAKSLWKEIDDATRAIHDFRLDTVTAPLAHVYRRHGAGVLEESLLVTAEQPWFYETITGNIDADPVARIEEWAFFLGPGNFGEVSVSEDAERFTIHHSVCGSCGRQELAGRYQGPCAYPRLAGASPLSLGHDDFTLYRAHLAPFHFMTLTKFGYPPYPAVDCTGIPGRCWMHLYKDPRAVPASFYESAGLVAPAGA